MNDKELFALNKNLWDARTRAHINSKFYDNESFLNGRNSLSKAELKTLGDVTGKSIIHLQCHFGQDTLSLARLGAKTTGVDISSEAIKFARQFNEELGLDSTFIECNVMDTLDHVEDTFDIVFVTFGATCWLPDLSEWAKIVYALLKPGGYLYYHEFHPTFYILDDKTKTIQYPYFNTGVMIEESQQSYTDNSSGINLKEAFWSHSMSEILTACLDTGLQIKLVNEYDFSPYNCFENMEKRAEREYVMTVNDVRLPHTLELIAERPI